MAFELEAFLYLRKLIIRKKLHSCLNGALYKVTKKCTIVYNDYTKEVIKFKDIQFIEAESKGTIVRNANNTYCIKNTMTRWEDALANQPFCHCYKSYIVNLMHVDKICKDYAVLCSGERVMDQ